MSTEPNDIQKLRSAIESGSRMLSGPHFSQYDLYSYITDIVRPLFLQKAVAHIFMPIKERHLVSAQDLNLVHYTSVDTLVKILQRSSGDTNGYLRLYDSAHFNDPDEGRYLTRITQWNEDNSDWLSSPVKAHAYITSFIPAERGQANDINDNLVFWRTYGNDGHGCSIEIPGTQLDGGDLPLLRVLYGRHKARKTVSELKELEKSFQDIHDEFDPVRGVLGEGFLNGIIKEIIAEEFELFSYLHKSEAYQYEKECRFVVTELETGNPTYEYINRESGHEDVRQYYEHEMLSAKNILVSGATITLGPSVKNEDRIESYLRHLLNEAGLLGPAIKQSSINYRG